MAKKLKNLKIRKVDFVDEGANPDAHIMLLKNRGGDRSNGGGDCQEGGKAGKESGVLKKLLAFIGRAAGLSQEEIDIVAEEVQKGGAFSERIHAMHNRKIIDEMWEICFALQSALCSVLEDKELDSAGAEEAMRQSLDEFYALVQETVRQWASGRTSGVVWKSEDASAANLAVMKSAMERLKKAAAGHGEALEESEDIQDNGREEGDKKEMKIDKSKMTEAEKAFLDSLEKRYGVDEGRGPAAVPPAVQTPAQPPAAVPPVTAPSPAAPAEGDDVYKGLHPAVRAELENLRKFREAAQDRELEDVAAKYEILGKKKEELVPLFKSLKAAGGTAYTDMIAILDQTAAAVEKSGLFSEIGRSGHSSADGSAWAEAEAKAAELMKSRTGMSKPQALDEVFMENPGLAERCEKEG